MKLKLNFAFLKNLKNRTANKVSKPSKPKVDLHPELALVNDRVQWKLWLLIVVVVIAFLSILLGLSSQNQLSTLSTQHQKVLQADFSEQNNVLAQLQQTDTQNQQTITQTLQQISSQAQTNQQALLQAVMVDQQQSKTTSTAIAQLQQQMTQLQKTVTAVSAMKNSTTQAQAKPQKIATGYNIFGVEPYGVVIQNAQGEFQIARIGQQLDIGEITAISANAVQAGDWTIVPKVGTTTATQNQTQPHRRNMVTPNQVPMSAISTSS